MLWLRELAGWLLVAISLYLVLVCLGFLSDRQVVEGGVLAMVAIFVFRGGLSLVKATTAARMLLRAVSPPRANKASGGSPDARGMR